VAERTRESFVMDHPAEAADYDEDIYASMSSN
jgi:hypothetical protein